MRDMSDLEKIELTADDFRELTPQEAQQDNFRRMLQLPGLIYANQVEIKQMLVTNNNPPNLV